MHIPAGGRFWFWRSNSVWDSEFPDTEPSRGLGLIKLNGYVPHFITDSAAADDILVCEGVLQRTSELCIWLGTSRQHTWRWIFTEASRRSSGALVHNSGDRIWRSDLAPIWSIVKINIYVRGLSVIYTINKSNKVTCVQVSWCQSGCSLNETNLLYLTQGSLWPQQPPYTCRVQVETQEFPLCLGHIPPCPSSALP